MAAKKQGRKLRHWLENAVAQALFGVFGVLPLPVASAIGGWLGGIIGPRLKRLQARARHNMTRALPELSPNEIERNLKAMWRHLGRMAAEFPHIAKLQGPRGLKHIEIVGAERLEAARDAKSGGIFFSGHIGNWELSATSIARYNVNAAFIYRAPNNPAIDRLIRRMRGVAAELFFPKGPAGARDIVRHIKGGGYLAMLMVQKMNDGIAVPFFGHDAMTAPSLAEIALKYDCPVWPMRIERLRGANFRVTVFPPMDLPRTDDHKADVAEIMRRVNTTLESWIRERPDQWLWPHRRWPD